MSSVEGVDDGVGYGLYGRSRRSIGVYGLGRDYATGVYGYSDNNYGVYGRSYDSNGVYGQSDINAGVYGYSNGEGNGLYGLSRYGYAAYLAGNVRITGNLQKGGGSFKIDHPLDPANKYLQHSFVESPDMKNVYDGIVVLDRKGKAEIELPDWFGALNKDFRYQLTPIGAPGHKISRSSFTSSIS